MAEMMSNWFMCLSWHSLHELPCLLAAAGGKRGKMLYQQHDHILYCGHRADIALLADLRFHSLIDVNNMNELTHT